MADSFSQIHIQVVFAVKFRESLIHSSWEEDLYRYITGIIQNKKQKVIAINGMPDHIHILIGLRPECALSDLVREIKKASTDFINEKKFCRYKFQWQEGYASFSYSKWDVEMITNYVRNQKSHHKKTSFKDEYLSMVKELMHEFPKKKVFDLDSTPPESIETKTTNTTHM